MRNRKLAGIIFIVVLGEIGLAYCAWPEGRDAAVRRHILGMESAWKEYAASPHAPENNVAFLHHRDELVRLGEWKQRSFEVPVRLGTAEGKQLVCALIDRAASRPVCEWTPAPTTTLVTVFASAEQMPQWESMLARWDKVP